MVDNFPQLKQEDALRFEASVDLHEYGEISAKAGAQLLIGPTGRILYSKEYEATPGFFSGRTLEKLKITALKNAMKDLPSCKKS